MRVLFVALVLLQLTACGFEQGRAGKHGNAPSAAIDVYQRALAYGTQTDLNSIDGEIKKNLRVRLYKIPVVENECFVETHGICQYEYLLSVSSFDEQPEVKIFKLPLVGEISRIGWRKHGGNDEAQFELSLNQYGEAALKNNPALNNVVTRHVLTANLKTVTVTTVNN